MNGTRSLQSVRRRVAQGNLPPRGSIRIRKESGASLARLRKLCGQRIFRQRTDALWRRVQEALEAELALADAESGTNKAGVFRTLREQPKMNPFDVCEIYHIEARTFYNWRNDILLSAMLIATEYGAFSLSRREIL